MIFNPLLRVLGNFKTTGKGELRFNCPLCLSRVRKRDEKYRLYVNPQLFLHGVVGWYYCMRCGASGPIKRLLHGYGVEDQRYNVSKWDNFVKQIKGFGEFRPKMKNNVNVNLPKDYMEIIEGSEAYQYLVHRGITNNTIDRYRIGFGTENLFKMTKEERRFFAGEGRVIIPDFNDQGECIYWVARTYRNHKLRYKNPEGSNSQDQIFHLTAAMAYTEVVITEGVFSAIAVGDDGVGTYGKNITPMQINMLVNARFSKYIVALDGDARKDAVKLAQSLVERRCNVELIEFDYHEDPGSCLDFEQRRDNALSYNLKNRVLFTIGGQGNAKQRNNGSDRFGKTSNKFDRCRKRKWG